MPVCVEVAGIAPAASRSRTSRSPTELHHETFRRGEWIRTIDLSVPNGARYQLRYTPKRCRVKGLEMTRAAVTPHGGPSARPACADRSNRQNTSHADQESNLTVSRIWSPARLPRPRRKTEPDGSTVPLRGVEPHPTSFANSRPDPRNSGVMERTAGVAPASPR